MTHKHGKDIPKMKTIEKLPKLTKLARKLAGIDNY